MMKSVCEIETILSQPEAQEDRSHKDNEHETDPLSRGMVFSQCLILCHNFFCFLFPGPGSHGDRSPGSGDVEASRRVGCRHRLGELSEVWSAHG